MAENSLSRAYICMFKSTKISMMYVGCICCSSLTSCSHIWWKDLKRAQSATGKAERWHSGLWREEQWHSRWRAAVVSSYTGLSQSLSNPRAKPWVAGTRWVFCFSMTKILTHNFVAVIHKKLYTSKSEAFILQSKYLCLHSTSGRRSPAADWHSESLWACHYCCRLGSKLKLWLLIPASFCSFPLFHLALCEAAASHPCRGSSHQALLPTSHLVLTSCSSELLELAVHPQTLPHPKRSNTYPPLHAGKAPFSQAAVQFHIISDTSDWKIHKKKQNYLLGPQGCQKTVQGVLRDVNIGVCSQGN